MDIGRNKTDAYSDDDADDINCNGVFACRWFFPAGYFFIVSRCFLHADEFLIVSFLYIKYSRCWRLSAESGGCKLLRLLQTYV